MAFFKTKFESHKQEWETPDSLFNALNAEFHFDIDLAADANNTKCQYYYDEKTDALKQDWKGTCWLNPPYSKKEYKLSNWIKKAFQESKYCTVVMLIPARTNTRWWHEYCMKAAEIRFINGRPRFGDAKYGLPQPLAIIVFKKHQGKCKFSSLNL